MREKIVGDLNGGSVKIAIDDTRDDLLTDFGRATLRDRYLLKGESYQDMFARVAGYYSKSPEHAQRIYDYISMLWFMPSTPVLSNGGTTRGYPISCFLNKVDDSLSSIDGVFTENLWLAARGGGIGTDWSQVRSIGERVGSNGKTSGIMPFMHIMDSMTLGISQGSLRRGSAATYLSISHPEIEEFIEMRRPTGGDPNRKNLNLHHGILVSDAFMLAVDEGDKWELKSPMTGEVIREVPARDLWQRILQTRIETGEPYIVFEDRVNELRPDHHKKLGLRVTQSNLCAEITLPTGIDHKGNNRTAVCCLSSLNLENYDAFSDQLEQVVYDVLSFLDCVLEDFVKRTEGILGFEKARYSAMVERSVGLGVMGFHSYLQRKGIPFESAIAKSQNNQIFKKLHGCGERTNVRLAEEYGSCQDAIDAGEVKRFSNIFAIAPTASISTICGQSSPGIEPYAANSFTQKTLSGSFNVRNKWLDEIIMTRLKEHYVGDVLDEKWKEIWSSITVNGGSVQHLTILTDEEKAVFKTAFEIDQRWIIEHAADRTPYISQSQSLNLFLPPNLHKRDLHGLHRLAWRRGIKSLYYCRSMSSQRAQIVSHVAGEMPQPRDPHKVILTPVDYSDDECLACQ